jgi:hypothetical protein
MLQHYILYFVFPKKTAQKFFILPGPDVRSSQRRVLHPAAGVSASVRRICVPGTVLLNY